MLTKTARTSPQRWTSSRRGSSAFRERIDVWPIVFFIPDTQMIRQPRDRTLRVDSLPISNAMPALMTVHVSHPTLPIGKITGFNSLWAFYTDAFDPRTHGQACLKGSRANNFNTNTAQCGREIALERAGAFPFAYVFGVAAGPTAHRDAKNLHLPLRYVPGQVVERMTYNGYRVLVTNAKELHIPTLPDYWNGLPDAHRGCKIFQFGVASFPECVPELQPARESIAHDRTLWRIQELFRGVILSRVREGSLSVPAHLPRLSRHMLHEEEPRWFPVPGMAGGFAYRMTMRGEILELVAESWCRMASGSEMTHRITEHQAILERSVLELE